MIVLPPLLEGRVSLLGDLLVLVRWCDPAYRYLPCLAIAAVVQLGQRRIGRATFRNISRHVLNRARSPLPHRRR